MGDRLREVAAREAQHETPVPADPPPTRDEKAMRRCDGCARLYVLTTGMERMCDDCAEWCGVGAGQ